MSTNAYENQRLANIKRNREYLNSLGLGDARELRAVQKKRKKEAPLRVPRVRVPEPRVRKQQAPVVAVAKPVAVSRRPSSSLVDALDATALLALAHPFALSKTEAMYALAGHRNFVFGKMSGIQQFANCVALFVNIDAGRYDNKHDERRLRWYAQSRQSASTPVIVRIVSGDEPVLLLVKLQDEYTFCGRVRVVERFATSPLSFTLELLDRAMPVLTEPEEI